MVYVSSSLSLATLELLVHIEDLSIIEDMYSVIPLTFSDSLVSRVPPGDLPAGWNSPEPLTDTQVFGDRWIRGASSAFLEVPSAVTASERNYLINPAHSDFGKATIGIAHPFALDPRL